MQPRPQMPAGHRSAGARCPPGSTAGEHTRGSSHCPPWKGRHATIQQLVPGQRVANGSCMAAGWRTCISGTCHKHWAPGEVDPFRVPELVAHEAQPCITADRHCYLQANGYNILLTIHVRSRHPGPRIVTHANPLLAKLHACDCQLTTDDGQSLLISIARHR